MIPRDQWPAFLQDEAYIAYKPIDDTYCMAVMGLTLGRGRLIVGRLDDPTGYLDGW